MSLQKVQAVRFLRRRNLGNYEHIELDVSDVIDPENTVQSVRNLMSFVEDALYEKGDFAKAGTPTVAATTAATTVAKPRKTNEKVQKVEEGKKENETQTAPVNSEEKPQQVEVVADSKAVETVGTKAAEVKVEETKPATEKKTAVETKVVVKNKGKNTVYDRTLDTHKQLLGQFLDKDFKTWRNPEELKKATKASKELNGKDFQDGEGEILQSFKDEFALYMKGEK